MIDPERILNKLNLAQKKDKDFNVYDSQGHRYFLDDPVSENAVNVFEKAYNIQLPICYKTFVTKVGNSGIGYKNSGAGPYHGIFPVGQNIFGISENPKNYLSNSCILTPDMSDEKWNEISAELISSAEEGEEFKSEDIERVYAGTLILGMTSGTLYHAIILNGVHKGKIVHYSWESLDEKPIFSKAKNFFDWYEKWLDDILAEEEIKRNKWYGY